MAIGLGRMFGFHFLENFNYPYISTSIKEFWRRWHSSLSTWFKEYIYIPLGGNRKGTINTYRNLLIVFLATGIWHGASWNFFLWGLIHGLFIILERITENSINIKPPHKIIGHIYTLLVILVAWVFFRAENITTAIYYLKTMFIPTPSIGNSLLYYATPKVIFIFFTAILICGPIQKRFPKLTNILYSDKNTPLIEIVFTLVIFFLCIIALDSNSYNPFIYFRF